MLKMIVIPLMFTAISPGCSLLALKKNKYAFRHVALYVIGTSVPRHYRAAARLDLQPKGVHSVQYPMDKAYAGIQRVDRQGALVG